MYPIFLIYVHKCPTFEYHMLVGTPRLSQRKMFPEWRNGETLSAAMK